MTDIAIAGAGPAGLAAAIQLKRYGFSPIVFESKEPGGLLHNANLIENYPGFPEGITGVELSRKLLEQAENHSVNICYQEIHKIAFRNNCFHIEAADNYDVRFLIVASGTRPKLYPLETIRNKAKLYYEIYDIKSLKFTDIAIIGAGDAAFDYALQLNGMGKKVTIISRSKKTACLPLLLKRVQMSSIVQLSDVEILSIRSDKKKTSIKGLRKNAEISLKFDLVLVAIGREPAIDFIDINSDKLSELKRSGRLFYAGDVQNGLCRQCAIATGDGLKAAMQLAAEIERGL